MKVDSWAGAAREYHAVQQEHFAAQGFVAVPGLLSLELCTKIARSLVPGDAASLGDRCQLSVPECMSLLQHIRRHPQLATLIDPNFVAVQCTYFEKSPARNWLVPMHQDLSIPVAERVDEARLHGWSRKQGTLFVQAPAEFLQQLIGVRVHLDDCSTQDGPLRVVPGSHLHGRLRATALTRARCGVEEFSCVAARGDALLLRPLLLHASSKSTGTSRRRVLHFLLGPRALPYGLRWARAV